MQCSRSCKRGIKRPYCVTVVIEAEVVPVGNWVALGPNTRKGDVEDTLVDKKNPVNGPRFEIRECRLRL